MTDGHPLQPMVVPVSKEGLHVAQACADTSDIEDFAMEIARNEIGCSLLLLQ